MPKKDSLNELAKRKYLFHKKTFNIKQTKLLSSLEKLMDGQFIECSCKVMSNKVYSSRFNIFFSKNENKTTLGKCFKFFEDTSKENNIYLNYSILRSLFNKPFDINKIKRIILGVDLREKIKDSRIKIYFALYDYPPKVEEILKIHGKNKDILNLINFDDLGFGIDFSFDGKTQIKIYPRISSSSLHNNSFLKKNFKYIFKKRQLFFKNIESLYISFKKPNFEKIIHFKSNKWEEIINLLNNNTLNKYTKFLLKNKFKLRYVSVLEKEIDKESISNFTFYY
jgi:LynF/TruF/PatF family peptide O-prenyltransferase